MKTSSPMLIDRPKRQNRGTPDVPANTMYFWIGVEVYTAYVTKDPIFCRGVECLGLAVYRTREILLAPSLPPECRLATLLHEVRHAWQFHFPGTSSTAEDEATTSSSIIMSIMVDFDQQGGESAVIALQPRDKDYKDYREPVSNVPPAESIKSRPKRGLRIAL